MYVQALDLRCDPDLVTDCVAALAVACRDVDVRNVKAMIIGPHETPYEFGFFEVSQEWWRYIFS